MKKLLLIGLLTLLFAGATRAQEAVVAFHPGDTIHILVTFKASPELFDADGATVSFGLKSDVPKDQESLGRNFNGNQLKSIGPNQIEISGMVPDHIASGTYRLDWMNVAIHGVAKQYTQGQDFAPVTVTILNSEKPRFPEIEKVTLAPPH